jgi:gas vesicle protein
MKPNKVILGVIGGVAVGAILGILFAPHKGSKTRKKILNKGKDYADELKSKFDGVLESVTEKYDSLLDEAKEYVSEEENTLK